MTVNPPPLRWGVDECETHNAEAPRPHKKPQDLTTSECDVLSQALPPLVPDGSPFGWASSLVPCLSLCRVFVCTTSG